MNITEEKLLEYLSKALVCVAVIVIGYIITRLIIGILRKILNKSRMDGTAEGFVLSVLKVIFYFIVAVTALGTIGVNVASLITRHKRFVYQNYKSADNIFQQIL